MATPNEHTILGHRAVLNTDIAPGEIRLHPSTFAEIEKGAFERGSVVLRNVGEESATA